MAEAHPRDPRWLWFGMVGSPVIWFIHFLVIYTIGEFGCRAGLTSRTLAGLPLIDVMVVVATLLAVIPVAYGGWVAFKNRHYWQPAIEDGRQGFENRHGDRRYFMALAGSIMSFAFVFVMLFSMLPIFFLDAACLGIAGG